MRQNIKHLDLDTPHQYNGYFNRTGYRVDRAEDGAETYVPTLLITNIKDEFGKLLTDHQWFDYTTDFQVLGQLKSGELLKFTATATTYIKGRIGDHHKDYQLTAPTAIALVRKAAHKPLPEANDALIGMIMKQNEKFYRVSNRPIDPEFVQAYTDWLEEQ